MKFDKSSLLLYAVTDRSWVGVQSLNQQVEETLKAGATFLQLREKDLSTEEFLREAREMKKLAAKYQVPFVINDNIEIAMLCDADGAHVGQADMKSEHARGMLGPGKILGVSVETVEQAKSAESYGADYLGVGAIFSTSTKVDATSVSYHTLCEICNAVSIPVVAIGGIGEGNIKQLRGSGIHGVAVISAIFASDSITNATENLLREIKGVVYNEESKRYIGSNI